MRLIAILVVLLAVGYLGSRALSASSSGSAGPAPATAGQARSVVDGARQQLDAAQAQHPTNIP